MCTWTGFVGRGNAAPVVLEMIEKIEGLWSGYYSGLVTADPAGLHYGKLHGGLRAWRERFSAADVPGGTALFHSRTNSGGEDESAHPFVAPDDAVAVVSQGSVTFFAEECNRAVVANGNRLLGQGAHFPSGRTDRERNRLADGRGVCMSEVVVYRVAEVYRACGDPVRAIRSAATEMPEESVSGFVFADRPETLYFVNTSQSIVAGRTKDGVCCSTTSLAFPAGTRDVTVLPYNAVITVTAAGWRYEPLAPRFDIMAEMPAGSEAALIRWLEAHPGETLSHAVDGALKPLCPADGRMYPRAATAYRTLEKLYAAGRLEFTRYDEVQAGLKVRA